MLRYCEGFPATQEKAAKLLKLVQSLQAPDAQADSPSGAGEDGDA